MKFPTDPLWHENDTLRERIRQLEDLLGIHTLAPPSFGLTATEARLFGVLMKRKLVTLEIMMSTVVKAASEENKRIFVHKLRRKLAPRGITIETSWGNGYFISAANKEKIRGLMREEGLIA